MTPRNILILFLGWLLYWVVKMNATFKQNGYNKDAVKKFILDSVFEIIISILSCAAIIIMGASALDDFLDLTKPISVLIAGYFSSSLIANMITAGKPKQITDSTTDKTTTDGDSGK